MGLGQKEDKIKERGERKGICYEVLLCYPNFKLDWLLVRGWGFSQLT
jgi:hypothetical protein